MEFVIALVHFLAVSTPLLILCGIAAIGSMQPLELLSQGHRELPKPAVVVWAALADEARVRHWAGETSTSSAYSIERSDAVLTLTRKHPNGSFRETWTIGVEAHGAHTRITVAQAVYAKSALYRGAMRLFFPPSADYERLLTAIEGHLDHAKST